MVVYCYDCAQDHHRDYAHCRGSSRRQPLPGVAARSSNPVSLFIAWLVVSSPAAILGWFLHAFFTR